MQNTIRNILKRQTALACLITLLLVACGPVAVAASSLSGRVTWIADGDTLQMVVHGREYLIRLAGIDAPERDQPWGHESRQALINLTLDRNARADIIDTDRYGRYVARVYVGQTEINRALVASGNAWVYRRYAKDEKLYALERQARAARKGLWSLPKSERIPPWQWRHHHDSYSR